MLERRANFRAWKMATGDSVADAPSLLPKKYYCSAANLGRLGWEPERLYRIDAL